MCRGRSRRGGVRAGGDRAEHQVVVPGRRSARAAAVSARSLVLASPSGNEIEFSRRPVMWSTPAGIRWLRRAALVVLLADVEVALPRYIQLSTWVTLACDGVRVGGSNSGTAGVSFAQHAHELCWRAVAVSLARSGSAAGGQCAAELVRCLRELLLEAQKPLRVANPAVSSSGRHRGQTPAARWRRPSGTAAATVRRSARYRPGSRGAVCA